MPLFSDSRGERSLKKMNGEAQRRAMNERRHEYTNRIRKAKKSQLLQLKRRYVPPTPVESGIASRKSMMIDELAWDYIRSKSAASLEALQYALSSARDTFFFQQVEVIPNEDTPAMQLANTLAYSLTMDTSIEVRLLSSRVLTNLAAMEPKDDDEMSYYERQPEGWCQVLIRSKALPALAQVLTSFVSEVDPSYMSSDGPVLEVCQQCCWAVGNLAGDSHAARDAARQAGVVRPLVTVLTKGMELKHTAVCKNAAWALSNLTRGVTTSGREFCGPSLLTPTLVASLLMSPEQQLSAAVVSFWWMDVANEMCWLLAFLTAREDDVVDFLCQPASDLAWLMPHTQNVVCAALSHRLDQAARVVSSATTSLSDTEFDARSMTTLSDTALRALRMSIPCLRSIGNIATASQGRHVAMLLHKTPILYSLGLLIASGCVVNNSDVVAVALEAAWAAGTLLCDAGLDGHASTMHACPALLPVLCRVVVSEYATLDLKREAVSALWNAVAPPPTTGDSWSSQSIRDGFLREIATCPGMVATLTGLMLSVDADLALGSVRLINALLRRLEGQVKSEFLEANGVDALEAVCDRASQDGDGGASSEYPEFAADLIDDFFGDEIEGTPTAMDSVPEGTSESNLFSFGVASEMQQTFDFRNQQSQPPAFPDASDGTVGRGRGRGRTMPAWVQHANK